MSKDVDVCRERKTTNVRITQITIGASRTINLGNYNSLKVEGSVTVEIDAEDGGLESLARAMAIAEVKKQLEEAYSEFQPNGK